jgi:protein-L-isoaspartate O-methyltransferase
MNGNKDRIVSIDADFEAARRDMVAHQIRDRGIRSVRVLDAPQTVECHLFVPSGRVQEAYTDALLPIGEDQTISQPFMREANRG